MKTLIFLLLCFPLPGRPGEEEPTTMARNQIRAFLEETETEYFSEDAEKFTEAAARFRALREQAPEGELNPDALKLAEGMAYLKAGQPEKTLEVFKEIEGFEDPELRGQLRQMKGNAHLQMAEAAVTREEWAPAKKEMDAAIESFINTLREHPEKEAARHNLEFAHRRLEEIKEMEPPPPPEQDEKQEEEEEEKQDQDQQDRNSPQNQDQQKQEDPKSQEPSDSQPEPSPQEPESENGQPREDSDSTEESPEDPEQQTEASDQNSNPQDSTSSAENASAGEGEPTQEEKLDAMQMQQILDSALEQEKRVRRLIQQQQIKTVPVEKDW